ncbi:MAG: fibronectin type III domain-containing protein [Acidimicrobiales bacterium]
MRIAPAGAAPGGTPFTMTTVRSTAVDPVTGRVFVAGDDKVVVFNGDGSLATTIPNVYGAGGMFVVGSDLWVSETTAGAIARIDIATSTLAQTFSVGMPVEAGLVVLGGSVWFTTPGASPSSYTALATLDPATGTVVSRGGSFYSAFIRTIPGVANRLLVGEPGLSPFSVYLLDTSGPTVAVLDDVPHGVGGNLSDLAVTADGARMVTASGAPYLFPEFAISNMDPTGTEYAGTYYPNGIAYTPARGGLFVGSTSSTNQLYVAAEGRPATIAQFTTSNGILPASVEVAPDGTRAYAVTQSYSATTASLETFDMSAAITSVSPVQTVAGVPATVTVLGRNLGGVTAATVDGIPADVSVTSSTEVRVEVPTSVAAGSRPLVLTGPLGSPSVPLTVVANIGATLSGTVRIGGVVAPGIELTLTGAGAPLTQGTTAGGTYSFTGVPYGTYSLVAHEPSGAHADVRVERIALVPNATIVQNLDLEVPPPGNASLARVTLPPGTARDVEFDPATSRIFVSVGDQVMVFNRDGLQLARIKNQFGADGLALGDGSVWVNQKTVGQISRIDAVSLTVTGGWPTTTATTGGIAFSSGKVFFTDGNDQWVGLAQLDPATGVVQKSNQSFYVPRFTNVAGVANRIFLHDFNIAVLNTAAFPPTSVVGGSTSGPDWVVSAARDRVWSSSGRERRLSTLAETGVLYPLNGTSSAVAYSPAVGGIVGTGRTISREGVPAASHLLADTPAVRSLALDTAGDRAYLVSGQTFVVWDLRPVLYATSPAFPAAPGTLTVTGSGLGAVTQVTVDGSPAGFSPDSAGQLTATLPALAAGQHQVGVVTPWGTTQRVFTVATPPEPPTDATAIAGNTTARVTWSAPAGTGGTPITGYQVLSSTGGRICTTSGALSCTVTGLTNGVAYSFRVRAANSVGFGLYSQPSNDTWPRRAVAPADFNGNGTTDKAVYRPSTGQWFTLGGSPEVIGYGLGDDIAVPGDYDGNGTIDTAVYRPSTGQWFVRGGSPEVVTYGASDDVPVPGDYDGNGSTDTAVFRPSTGQWFVRGGSPQVIDYGAPGDVPVPGDYDGNGSTDTAVFRPSTGQWFVRGGSPELSQYGANGDVPAPGDYDGNGTTNTAVFRPSTGQWFVRGGSPELSQYGASGDTALPLPYAIRRVLGP